MQALLKIIRSRGGMATRILQFTFNDACSSRQQSWHLFTATGKHDTQECTKMKNKERKDKELDVESPTHYEKARKE